jgi:hypothetical protein
MKQVGPILLMHQVVRKNQRQLGGTSISFLSASAIFCGTIYTKVLFLHIKNDIFAPQCNIDGKKPSLFKKNTQQV